MGSTFAQKALAIKAGKPSVQPGDIVVVQPDVLLSHDNTAAIYSLFLEMGGREIADPQKLAIFLDHAAPAPTTKHAENHRVIREFVRENGIEHFFDVGRGICHQVLVESGLALPGELILGSDSHTTHAGVMGAFAAGIGRSEMASLWALGETWLRVPESLKITVQGRLPPFVTAKDLALQVIGQLGAEGALYRSVEWHGETIERMSLDQRAVLPNMSAEMGAKNSYLPPNAAALDYLAERAARGFLPLFPDPDAHYAAQLEIQAEQLEPMIALPHTVDNVKSLSEVQGLPIDQAFLGTCTNGRLEDLLQAAEVLQGRRLSSRTRMIVIPASSEVYLEGLKAGALQTLLEAGAILQSPGCGPCMGNHLGVPAVGEVTLSTANRNFRGRMGTPESEIYLANPSVVAASAVAGHIIHPQDL